MQIFIYISTGIVTEVTFTFAYFLYNYSTFFTCIGYDLAQRLFNSTLDNVNTCSLIDVITFETFQCIECTDVSYTTTWYDTFFNSSTCCT